MYSFFLPTHATRTKYRILIMVGKEQELRWSYEISGRHGGEYEDNSLLRYRAM
jgi:hypothetical protein